MLDPIPGAAVSPAPAETEAVSAKENWVQCRCGWSGWRVQLNYDSRTWSFHCPKCCKQHGSLDTPEASGTAREAPGQSSDTVSASPSPAPVPVGPSEGRGIKMSDVRVGMKLRPLPSAGPPEITVTKTDGLTFEYEHAEWNWGPRFGTSTTGKHYGHNGYALYELIPETAIGPNPSVDYIRDNREALIDAATKFGAAPTDAPPPDRTVAESIDAHNKAKCARCDFPRHEHHHDGACYGICGEFVSAIPKSAPTDAGAGLRECPFCRSVRVTHIEDMEPNCWVECEDCGARTKDFATPEEAAVAWNTRSPLRSETPGDGAWLINLAEAALAWWRSRRPANYNDNDSATDLTKVEGLKYTADFDLAKAVASAVVAHRFPICARPVEAMKEGEVSIDRRTLLKLIELARGHGYDMMCDAALDLTRLQSGKDAAE